jgi:hypothetical protein
MPGTAVPCNFSSTAMQRSTHAMRRAIPTHSLGFFVGGKRLDMPSHPLNILWRGVAALSATFFIFAVGPKPAGAQQAAAKSSSSPAALRDLTGVWQLQGNGSAQPIAADADMPPMTPWAKARFDQQKPGYGARGAAGGNDPILQCDPIGFPRIMLMPTPNELVQTPGRVLQFWEREHEWRSIWTDGRALPADPDPTWYGYAIGHWEPDGTFVVESTGFNDTTWLGPTGYPHSDEMRIVERYRRVDHDTISYDMTITDPKSYTKPVVTPHRIMKLKPKEEISEQPCVWSEENEFTQRIRNPATPQPAK